MHAADPVAAVPREVLARLGPSPRELGRLGSSRVLEGNGLVLKAGPPDRAAREAFVLGELVDTLPLRLPPLLEAGEGWLLIGAVDVVLADPAAALSDLAALHDALAHEAVLADRRLRDVAGDELPTLVDRSTALAAEMALPDPLLTLAADPRLLLAALTGPTTLVHGDAWPGNVLATQGGGRCWIDWEEAGRGHAALDLANWLHGSPWVSRSPSPEHDLAVYLAARKTAVDDAAFRRAVDAAVVLLFLLLDLPGIRISEPAARREFIDRRAAAARRLLR